MPLAIVLHLETIRGLMLISLFSAPPDKEKVTTLIDNSSQMYSNTWQPHKFPDILSTINGCVGKTIMVPEDPSDAINRVFFPPLPIT